ncbi:MAG TPA: RNA polymerase sigma factor [Terriglobales bacterium]|nr:RNA polymerase sigma factor [Terriglobales bacterium]
MTDADLVASVLGGNLDAFAVLVDRYHDDCRRLARHLLGHEHDAEDATQETFLRAYAGLARYDERNAFRSWLYRILVNQCRTLGRQRRRRDRRFVQDPEALGLAAGPPGDADGELRQALAAALAGLAPRLREAFLLKHGEGLDYAEMSRITGVGISALKMRVKRAADEVRPKLERLLRG